MKYFILISSLCLFLFSSCFDNKSREHVIPIDLNRAERQLSYSSFADSLNYITLELWEDINLSEVEKLHVDGDYLLIQDRRSGLFVFSLAKRTLLKNINYFGNGPGEFNNIRAFTFNPTKKQLIIYSYPFVHKYTYDGAYVESVKNEDMNLVDFYCTQAGEYICIASEETGPQTPCGVWLVDSTMQYVKMLKEIPLGQKLFTRSTFYNRTESGIYYYDRVWDDFSFITNDSVRMIYEFDFKQRVPAEKRKRENPFNELREYSIIGEFVNSDKYILLNYFQFGSGDLSWVLLDKTGQKTIVAKHLHNDLSPIEINSNKLFYIDDRTWCRVLDFGENDTTMTLEFIYVKR